MEIKKEAEGGLPAGISHKRSVRGYPCPGYPQLSPRTVINIFCGGQGQRTEYGHWAVQDVEGYGWAESVVQEIIEEAQTEISGGVVHQPYSEKDLKEVLRNLLK